MRGKVVAADNGRPLRRARVTLTGIGLGPEARRMTSAGLDGAFVFKDLPAARYRVTVTPGGYLQLEWSASEGLGHFHQHRGAVQESTAARSSCHIPWQGRADSQGGRNVHLPHVFGRARFQVTVPEGWMLKRVQHDGRDVADSVIELRSGEQVTGVEILITNRVTELSGRVVDDKGAPVGDATVLVFPADAERWFENSRAIRADRPDQ